MSGLRQAVLGALAALLSSTIVLGSLALSMLEGGLAVAHRAPQALTTASELPAQPPVATPAPGEPTFTLPPSPEPSATAGLPTAAPNCAFPAGWTLYTILPGDTLESVALQVGVTADQLRSGNCLTVDTLLPNTQLFVPPLPPTPTATPTLEPTQPPPTATEKTCDPPRAWVIYIIRSGDTLSAISQATGASLADLVQANCLKSRDKIYAGMQLWVPRLPPAPVPYKSPTRFPTLPPTATFPPPPATATEAPPPTPEPPTPEPPTPEPPTPVPTDTPAPPTTAPEPPTETPVTPDTLAPLDTPVPTEPPANPIP